MLPSTAATPDVSPMVRARLRARRQMAIAAAGPARLYAATPARRVLSAQTFAARRSPGQASNRATSRTKNESRHAAA